MAEITPLGNGRTLHFLGFLLLGLTSALLFAAGDAIVGDCFEAP